MLEPYTIIIILAITMILFIWGRWRYDVVALIALMMAVIVRAVPFDDVYSGLSNPAVITVACVMIISQSISRSGILENLVDKVNQYTKYPGLHVLVLSIITAILSAFMNNVGALGLMMPIAIQTAKERNRSPSMILMPIALASALGGLTTVIGTPPNLLISSYRQQINGQPFSMFDFSYVGIWVALVGILFIALIGWRLLPKRQGQKNVSDLFEVQDYITELLVAPTSSIINSSIEEIENLHSGDYVVLGIIRNKRKKLTLTPSQRVNNGDILIIEASPEILKKVIAITGMELISNAPISPEALKGSDVSIVEAVIPQGASVDNRSSQSLRLRSRFHTNLLALSREGKPFKERLNQVRWKAGDIVLLQGPTAMLEEAISRLGLLPLERREIAIAKNQFFYLPLVIFISAIILTITQVMPVQVAFGAAVLAMLITNTVPVRRVYEMIEWPIILLLAAMIPVGHALQTTGGTALIAHFFTGLAPHASPLFILSLLMLVTMTLSDFMNNAATTVVMAPIAISIARALNVNIDPFLMGIAVSASCSFLTPVGHQNNTLVMGPGGYKFIDYIRVGLPLEILVLMISIPCINYFWPLN